MQTTKPKLSHSLRRVRAHWIARAVRKGLTVDEAALFFGVEVVTVRLACKAAGVVLPDRRGRSKKTNKKTPAWASKCDWSLSLEENASRVGLTSERVRQVGVEIGMWPNAAREEKRCIEAVNRRMRIESRRRLKKIARQAARRKTVGDLPINWQLSNRDIAAAWGLYYPSMGPARRHYKMFRPRWDARSDHSHDHEYREALHAERVKAEAYRKSKGAA